MGASTAGVCVRVALFEAFMVYGEDRDNPGVQHKFVVADDAKQAELKSGLVADPAWDFDYIEGDAGVKGNYFSPRPTP